MAGDTKSFNRPKHKFSFVATYPGLQQRAGRDRVHREDLRDWEWLWERTKRVATGIPVLSHPHTAAAILLRQTTPLLVEPALGQTISRTPGGILARLVVLKPDWGLQSD